MTVKLRGGREWSVDSRSYELALHFLPDNVPEEWARELSQVIQDSVEAWRVDCQTCDGSGLQSVQHAEQTNTEPCPECNPNYCRVLP